MTAYAVDGLIQAREHGVRIQEWRIGSGAGALRRLYDEYPRAIPDLKAYIVYVLLRTGQSDAEFSSAAVTDLWSSRERMTATGQALLLMTLDRLTDSRAGVLAAELAASAQTRGDLSWWAAPSDPLLEDFADTSVEASALALKALAARDPQNPLLEGVARWLVANRNAGAYWVSTKQTAIALDGLLAYMRARDERPAPVTAEIYVNGMRVASQAFDARSLTAPNPVLDRSARRRGRQQCPHRHAGRWRGLLRCRRALLRQARRGGTDRHATAGAGAPLLDPLTCHP